MHPEQLLMENNQNMRLRKKAEQVGKSEPSATTSKGEGIFIGGIALVEIGDLIRDRRPSTIRISI